MEADGLGVATVLQPFSDATEGTMGRVGEGNVKVGGLLSYQGRLFQTAYLYYDAAGAQTMSHFVSGMDLTVKGDIAGPFRVGKLGAGFVSRYFRRDPGGLARVPGWAGSERQLLPQYHQPHLLRSGSLRHRSSGHWDQGSRSGNAPPVLRRRPRATEVTGVVFPEGSCSSAVRGLDPSATDIRVLRCQPTPILGDFGPRRGPGPPSATLAPAADRASRRVGWKRRPASERARDRPSARARPDIAGWSFSRPDQRVLSGERHRRLIQSLIDQEPMAAAFERAGDHRHPSAARRTAA